MKKIIIIILSIIILSISFIIYKELEFNIESIELPKKYNAKCLDGSPYKFQYIKGINEGKNNYIIYFEGGGYCGSELRPTTTIESCRKRALTSKGKNTLFPFFILSRFMKFFSSKKKHNPIFYDWNKVIIKYCDGMGHLSNKDNYGLFFRGLNNTLGIIDYINEKFNFKNADKVIISGYSAGAISALQWSKFIDNYTLKKNNTFLIIDSGIFVSIDKNNKNEGERNFDNLMKDIVKYSGDNDIVLKSYCKYYNNEEERFKCYIPEIMINEVKIPILVLQNEMDSWMISHFLKESCFFNFKFLNNCSPDKIKKIQNYGKQIGQNLKKIYEENDNIGMWIPKTIGHVLVHFNFFWDNTFYSVNNYNLMNIINNWYKNVSIGNKYNYFYTDNSYNKINNYIDMSNYMIIFGINKLEDY